MNLFSRTVLRVVSLGFFAFILAVTCFGCGKKGPPLPPVQEMISSPFNLEFILDGTTATLTWSHGGKKGAPPIVGFEIDQATRGLSPDDCKGCPLRFVPLATTGVGTLEFIVDLEPGAIYYFRVRAYTSTGVFSDSSNTVQVELEK